ncbi:unnamed protein product [Vitrella brassicaformis CCMP3155]|uniref:Uncharacterized protein n=1 Tax=Vitrella brassicaformis (strain CCMP3155) TaxID=1169540 RepID=A0A0G4EN51_VITBC|nr:unnamed protein product [Vitrella brassicaformis CCMP3155]|eukprot:CEL99267.1 unnamed protein product [Vitrella brassicaformis CCMP3155]
MEVCSNLTCDVCDVRTDALNSQMMSTGRHALSPARAIKRLAATQHGVDGGSLGPDRILQTLVEHHATRGPQGVSEPANGLTDDEKLDGFLMFFVGTEEQPMTEEWVYRKVSILWKEYGKRQGNNGQYVLFDL